MKRSLLAVLTLAAFACGSVKLAAPLQTDADRASAKFPGTSLAMLNEGKAHYEANCGKCHGLKSPRSESEQEWRRIVPIMAKKAEIDSRKEDLILRYVIAMRDPQAGK